MRVGIDDALHSFFFRERPPTPIEIEPLRRGIDLDPRTGFGGGFDNRWDVDRVRIAFQEQPARGMREHRDQRIAHRANYPARHVRF